MAPIPFFNVLRLGEYQSITTAAAPNGSYKRVIEGKLFYYQLS